MFNLIKMFFSWLLSPIINALDFPVVPAELSQIVTQVFGYMKSGMSIVNFFCPLSLIRPALTVFLAVFAGYHAYLVIMWVLRKLPFVGVK